MLKSSVLGMDPKEFLLHYWQKKPLLVRGAFPGGLTAVDGDTLAGLAMESGVESRLVIEHGQTPWETKHGPFAEELWSQLAKSHWTLLVQAVDRLLPEVSQLRDHFQFLPNWRVDDIMISYAVDQGSVGPHTDNYDVFLIQGQGCRQWQIGGEALHQPALINGLDLKILQKFNKAEDFLLEAGDMLYLPPGFAHHGIALGESITYSVGFRAPEKREMLQSFFQFYQQQDLAEVFYRDVNLKVGREPGLILADELAALRQHMLSQLTDEKLFYRWIGGFLTEPRSFHELPTDESTVEDIRLGLQAGRSALRAEGVQIAYYAHNQQFFLAAEGESMVLNEPKIEPLLAFLSRQQRFIATELLELAQATGGMELLSHLWNQAVLRWEDNDEV